MYRFLTFQEALEDWVTPHLESAQVPFAVRSTLFSYRSSGGNVRGYPTPHDLGGQTRPLDEVE